MNKSRTSANNGENYRHAICVFGASYSVSSVQARLDGFNHVKCVAFDCVREFRHVHVALYTHTHVC